MSARPQVRSQLGRWFPLLNWVSFANQSGYQGCCFDPLTFQILHQFLTVDIPTLFPACHPHHLVLALYLSPMLGLGYKNEWQVTA